MTMILRVFAASVLVLAAAPARAQLDDAARAKILADPGYKAYEAKRREIVRSGLKGDARLKALAALQEANRTVIEKAFRAAGFSQPLFVRPQVHTVNLTAPAFTMDGDTRVYTAPFPNLHTSGQGTYASPGGSVVTSTSTEDFNFSDITVRSAAGVRVDVPANAAVMVVSADVEVGRIQMYTNCGLNSAIARAGITVQAYQPGGPGEGWFDQQLMELKADIGTHLTWADDYPYPGIKHVTLPVVAVTPGAFVWVSAGFYAWGHSGRMSDVFASATGYVRKLYVRFIYPPAPTPTPIAIVAATAAPKVNAAVAQSSLAGPPDLALSALPAGDGWPMELVVTNVGGRTSESTLVRAKLALKNAADPGVAASCSPKFVDFDEAVPALAPGATAKVSLLPKLSPGALAAWNAANRPAPARAAVLPGPTPTRAAVAHVVECRYTLAASLGTNQNRDDPHPENNALTREIREAVSAK